MHLSIKWRMNTFKYIDVNDYLNRRIKMYNQTQMDTSC